MRNGAPARCRLWFAACFIAATCICAAWYVADAPRPLESSPAGVGESGEVADPPFSGTAYFVDEAHAAGVDFRYDNGDDPAVPGMMLYQNFGGAVAVLDYDEDGWPDLYFAQGGRLGSEGGEGAASGLPNRLYRNLGGRRFADATSPTGTGDVSYGQCVAVGDYDCDGFSDVYVANIGRNRLYRNNGDGSFSDVSEAAGLTTEKWTAGCMLADLNGDGFAEIYDVNYLAGSGPFTQVCPVAGQVHPRSCKPDLFEAEQDRLLVNLGDGTFSDVTGAAGISAADGKGLGVVAIPQAEGRLPDVFVSNDTTPNFLFVNETAPGSGLLRFFERASESGVAVDFGGYTQAGMGIAVADADHDMRLDVFVTNFYNEFNTLYLQESPGQFVDATQASRLAAPSRQLLGFGTQFLDFDLDGWEDLVVANGHVDDYRFEGVPYQMRPQLFRNLGGAEFQELGDAAGGVFRTARLGRGLARLDWNGDGRPDFVVSNIHAPVTLASNTHPNPGNFVKLLLRGRVSNRDAVGARLTVRYGTTERLIAVMGGGGYGAANDREQLIGTGAAERVDELRVQWPSGRVDVHEDLATGGRWVVLESTDELPAAAVGQAAQRKSGVRGAAVGEDDVHDGNKADEFGAAVPGTVFTFECADDFDFGDFHFDALGLDEDV